MPKVLKIIGVIVLILMIVAGVGLWRGYRWVAKNVDDSAVSDMATMIKDLSKLSPETRQKVQQCVKETAERNKNSPQLEAEMNQKVLRQCPPDTTSKDEAQKCLIRLSVELASQMTRDCIARYQK